MKYPALAAWHDEMRRGLRKPTTLDALWRAACAEANAREFAGTIPALHAAFMTDARRIIKTALRARSP